MQQPSAILLQNDTPTLSALALNDASIANKKKYEKKLKKWQQRLLHVQQAYYHQNRRAIIVFEGWDAGGKGGAIRRLTERLDPRGFQVHPIGSPEKEEQGKHYLYRFQTRLPAPGKIAIFDRSWYGRVLVERVEAFASKPEWQRAYQEINEFERMLSDDGVRIIKIFLHISPEEQLKRFTERLGNPTKRWKLTEEDIRNRNRWPEYAEAIEQMFEKTSTKTSPWHPIAGNHKWYARLKVLKHIVKTMEKGVDLAPPPVNPDVLIAARQHLGLDV
ncbi:polyphosphate kinase 2 family protein [Neptunomonas antarctica]|uniref:Polyphosphate:AMP phosphotransferase n=1 Tax=Neptunomonas antarctica TaxID=619304 RepID=A0A1N7KHT5_9GAMM|nr:PPK2 family polyphosphate kinase [Neptunomonas antarctica]SIS61162.1 Polyphosphate:AMP phosphotransferase [Neptunomonas antarctica]